MNQADYIKAINEADENLKVDESLTVKQLKAIYDGQQDAKKLVEAKAQVKNLSDELKALSEENKSLLDAYEELQKANQEEEAKAKAGIKGPTVKIGKDLYRTTGKALRTRKEGAVIDITAEELVKDQGLCKDLVKSQSGFLVKVELEND